MALVTITGYPSSGKSGRVEQIKRYLEKKLEEPGYEGVKYKVVVLSDDGLGIKRGVYDGEFFEVLRFLSPGSWGVMFYLYMRILI